MTSQINSDFVWKTCSGEHIPEEKIYTVLKLVGYVLLGFLHPEDLESELKSELNIDQKIADAIAAALGNRIFTPLKNDLDKIYGPPQGLEAAMPKFMEEIKAPAAAVTPPTAAPTAAPRPLGEFERLGKITAPPSFAKPFDSAPAVADAMAGRQGKPAAPEEEPPVVSEAEPLPVIIHEEKPTAQPLAVAPGFRIAPPPPKISSEPPAGGISAPPRPAVLEFAQVPKPPTAPQPKPTSDEIQRVVHYTNLRTPLVKPPQMERTEITAMPSPTLRQAQGKPLDTVQDKPQVASRVEPFDAARGKPIDATQGKPPVIATRPTPPTIPTRPTPPPTPPRPTAPPAYTAPITPPTIPTKEPRGEFEKMRSLQKQQPAQTTATKPPAP
jgi:hypothetical protein